MIKAPGTIRLVYFAWVRERIGRSEEEVSPPQSVTTIAELMDWLSTRGDEYQAAFANPNIIRAAIDQAHCPPSSSIANANEIAFFPPVTGG